MKRANNIGWNFRDQIENPKDPIENMVVSFESDNIDKLENGTHAAILVSNRENSYDNLKGNWLLNSGNRIPLERISLKDAKVVFE